MVSRRSDRIIASPLFDGLVYSLAAAGLAGPIILCLQIVGWLRDGVWPSVTVGTVLAWLGASDPTVSWIGVQKILAGVLNLEIWITLPAAALAAMLLTLWLLSRVDRPL